MRREGEKLSRGAAWARLRRRLQLSHPPFLARPSCSRPLRPKAHTAACLPPHSPLKLPNTHTTRGALCSSPVHFSSPGLPARACCAQKRTHLPARFALCAPASACACLSALAGKSVARPATIPTHLRIGVPLGRSGRQSYALRAGRSSVAAACTRASARRLINT